MKDELIRKSIALNRKLNQLCVNKDNIQKKCSKIGRMECALLMLLDSRKNGICMNDLSEELSVSHSRITRIVDTLVEKGFAVRYPSDNDRRKWFAKITENGSQIANSSHHENVKIHEKLLSKIPEEKIGTMIDDIYLYLELYQIALKEYEEEYGSTLVNQCIQCI